MDIQSISVKELREQLPKIRKGLLMGSAYLLIYRSKPIARLEPITQKSNINVRIKPGTLRLQVNSKHQLTPEYLNELASKKYE